MVFNSFPPPFLTPNLKWAVSKGLFLPALDAAPAELFCAIPDWDWGQTSFQDRGNTFSLCSQKLGCTSTSQNKSSDYKCWSWMGKAGNGVICLAKTLLRSQASICFGMVPLNLLGSTMWPCCSGCPSAQTHSRLFGGDMQPPCYIFTSEEGCNCTGCEQIIWTS